MADLRDQVNMKEKVTKGHFSPLDNLSQDAVLSIINFLEKKEKLSLNATSKSCHELLKDHLSVIDKNEIIYKILTDSQYGELLQKNNQLSCFREIVPVSKQLLETIKSYYVKLFSELNKTDSQKLLLSYYKQLVDKKGNVTFEALNKAVQDFRFYLYENEKINYRIVFHVEKSGNLNEIIQQWSVEKPREFAVSPHETFFYSMRDESLSLLQQGSIVSIFVMLQSSFSLQGEYQQKSDYQREYTLHEPNNSTAKKKQSHIGSSTYIIHPGFRIVTWRVGENNTNKLGFYAANKNIIPGIEIALTKDPKIALETYLPNYLEELKERIFSVNPHQLNLS